MLFFLQSKIAISAEEVIKSGCDQSITGPHISNIYLPDKAQGENGIRFPKNDERYLTLVQGGRSWQPFGESKNGRPERWIVTIPSSDQWIATIENHWKTIVSNGCQTTKPLKNHWYQWFSDQKPLENHCYQWFWRLKTIVKPLTSMVAFQPFI